MDDLRSFPDSLLRLYTYSFGAWGFGLIALFAADKTPFAVTLCYPLALWLGGLTLWWGLGTLRRLRAGELEKHEVDAGIVSIGRILAGGGAVPAIVFLAVDPLAPEAWGSCLSIAVVCALAWFALHALAKLSNRFSGASALLLAWLVLPVNATGAISIGFWLGWFQRVQEVVG